MSDSDEMQEIKTLISRQNDFMQTLLTQIRSMQESEGSAIREVREDIKNLAKSISELATSLSGSNNNFSVHKALVEQRLEGIEKSVERNAIDCATNEKAVRALGKSLDDLRAHTQSEQDKERSYLKGMLAVGGAAVTVFGAIGGVILTLMLG